MGEAYNEGQRQRPLPNLESADTPAPIDVIHDHITRQLQSGDPAVRNSAFARYPFLSPQYYKSVGQTTQGFINAYPKIGAMSAQGLATTFDNLYFRETQPSRAPFAQQLEQNICRTIETISQAHPLGTDLSDEERYNNARELLQNPATAADISREQLATLLTPPEDTTLPSDESYAITLSTAYFFTMLSDNPDLYTAQIKELQSVPNKYLPPRVKAMIKQTQKMLKDQPVTPLREITKTFLTLPRTDWMIYLQLAGRDQERAQKYREAAAELNLTIQPSLTEEPYALFNIHEAHIQPNTPDDWAPIKGYRELHQKLYPAKRESRDSRDQSTDKKPPTSNSQPRSTLRALVNFRQKLSPGNVFELCDNQPVLNIDGSGLERPPQNEYTGLQFRKLDENGDVLFEGSIADNPIEGYAIFYRTDTSKTGASPAEVAKCSPREAQRVHGARLILHATPEGIEPDDCMQQKIAAYYNATKQDYRTISFWGLKPDPGPDGQPLIRVYHGHHIGNTALRTTIDQQTLELDS